MFNIEYFQRFKNDEVKNITHTLLITKKLKEGI